MRSGPITVLLTEFMSQGLTWAAMDKRFLTAILVLMLSACGGAAEPEPVPTADNPPVPATGADEPAALEKLRDRRGFYRCLAGEFPR